MRITFIRPSLHGAPSSDAMEPLGLAVLAALTPRDVETRLLDERVEPLPPAAPTDLVALTVETYTARRAYQIAGEYRRRGVPVVMGGHHPTLLPDEALAHADAIVLGDAEGLWEQVVADAAGGGLRRVYEQAAPPPLAGMRVDRSIFRGKRYVGLTLVQLGRGCRHACEFCSVHAFYGHEVRQRPVGEVIEEIAQARARHVFFVDDDLFADPARARALCEALIPLRLRWSCQISSDMARDSGFVDLLRRSGCSTVLVGFESLDPANLRQMGKGWSGRDGGPASFVRALHAAGIMVYGTFVFGYDADTPAAFDATVDFAVRNRLLLANFNPLTPTPGTRLFDRLRREHRLLHPKWWLDPGYRYGQACFRPRGMTPQQLSDGCWRARRRFYSRASIVGRLARSPETLRSARRFFLYLGANLISRREVRAKQGRALGAPARVEPAGAAR